MQEDVYKLVFFNEKFLRIKNNVCDVYVRHLSTFHCLKLMLLCGIKGGVARSVHWVGMSFQ